MTPLERDAEEKYGQFILEALEPWTHIEGSEIGDAMQSLHEAAWGSLSYLDGGIKVVYALDHAVREMLKSDWFTEMLGEEQPPYDYYVQGVKTARSKAEEIRHKHIASCKQFGGKYGGAEAEEWIKGWTVPEVILPGEDYP